MSTEPCPYHHFHHPDHMKGWEAFGVTDVPEPSNVRRLGYRHHLPKPTYGTDPFGKGETRNGVASIEIHQYSDDTHHGYVYVTGTTERGVVAGWKRAAAMLNAASLWGAT